MDSSLPHDDQSLAKEPKDKKSPEDVFDILENVPQESRHDVMQFVGLFASMTKTNPEAEVLKKVTDKNIDHFIDSADRQHEREIKDRKGNRQFIATIFIFSSILLIAIILLLKNSNPNLMKDIILGVLAFAAGFGGGYGVRGGRNNE